MLEVAVYKATEILLGCPRRGAPAGKKFESHYAEHECSNIQQPDGHILDSKAGLEQNTAYNMLLWQSTYNLVTVMVRL